MSPDLLKKNQKSSRQPSGDSNTPLRSYAQWSGLVFQMAVVVTIMSFLGWKADQWTGSKSGYLTLAGILTGVIAAMLLAIRMVSKKN
jgi:hypothetical protein